jgi:2-hydroxycyclohexanecarboxyl-CoA dehydrogenase
MDLGLAGKTAIVTGGASNIGKASVLGFAREGANVVITDMDEKQYQKTAVEAKALGGDVLVIPTDAGSKESVEVVVDRPDEEIEKEIRLTFWSVIHCNRAVARNMIERKYGKIVTLGSGAGGTGPLGGPTTKQTARSRGTSRSKA